MEVPNQRNEKADGATEDSKEPKTKEEKGKPPTGGVTERTETEGTAEVRLEHG
jgi:hypothetical protein